jgi:hypothetical protein
MTQNQKEYLLLDIAVPGLILIAVIVIALLVMTIRPAEARCPPGTSWGCYPSYDGKQVCGCR